MHDTSHDAVLAMGLRLSVCLSVTSRYSIESAERIELVFWRVSFLVSSIRPTLTPTQRVPTALIRSEQQLKRV